MNIKRCETSGDGRRDGEKTFTAYASRFLWVLLSPKGMINRGEFLAALIVLVPVQAGLVFTAFIFALGTVNNASSVHHDYFTLTAVAIAFFSYCFFAASIKRWRDLGGDIWVYIISYLIPVGLLVLTVMCIFVRSSKLNAMR